MTIAAFLGILGCAGAICMGVSQVGKGTLGVIEEIKKRKAEKSEDKEED